MLPADLDQSRRLTRALATSHYENFLVSSVLLPRPMRQPFYDVYAFCRTADDAADESPTPQIARRRLADLRRGLAAMFDGQADSALFVALGQTVQQYRLPRQPMDDLLDAFDQDQTKHQYDDDHELLDYCRRSANPVGRMVLAMAGVEDEPSLRASDSICTGLQLVNFWQDIARDQAIGRCYVPLDRMRAHGVERGDLAAAVASDRVIDLVKSLNQWARSHFEPADALAAAVPRWLSPSIELFAGGGLATCRAIERVGFDVLGRRPVVRKRTQCAMVLRHLASRIFSSKR